MKAFRFISITTFIIIGVLPISAFDYLTYLTPERGFVEVKQTKDIISDSNYYYILTSAEDNGLIVGIGDCENKPGWASTMSKALRYFSAETDPILVRSNFFTIEKSENYIGFRNLVYSADLFQTHEAAGFMYVNTFTDKSLDQWSHLSPTYQDDYWIFESGKYPIAEGDYYSGYLGPWYNRVSAGEAIALNRKNTPGDEAGHYRLFRIAKEVFETLYTEAMRQQLYTATASQPVDATWLIVNPSFETGDVTGWTRIPNVTDDNEFNTRELGMTDKEGGYLFNAYRWWTSSLEVTQTVEHVPSGKYELSAVVATWANRDVTFTGNSSSVTKTGINEDTGIPLSLSLTITGNDILTISAGSTAQWWVSGHEEEKQTFFKLDDVRLICQGIFLDGMALPLPNNTTTLLKPNQWYYYEVDYPSLYILRGNITDMVYSTNGYALAEAITTQPVERRLTLATGRVYFKTTRSDATLSITSEREVEEAMFTATALNVDGLPQKVEFVTLNEDGPGSDGTKLISKYLAKKNYDIIGVSEDFNYHGSLMSALDDKYDSDTVRATISLTNLNIPFDTDGLNLLWKKGLVDKKTRSWTRWGTTTSTDGNQYVKKGFRHYEMTPGDSMVIDVYVLHMDAGDKSVTSREAQWEQLADSIRKDDSNRPKLVIGDTNSRWTREDIKSHFFDKLPQYNISDAWVQLCRNNVYPTTSMADFTDDSDPTIYSNYEVVDKIIYLNPKTANTVQLSAQSFKVERDYIYGEVDGSDSAKPLGDHRPVVVEFKCLKSGKVKSLAGDVNRDGRINVSDVMATVSIIMERDNVEPYVFDHFAADINEDGKITVTDIMSIVSIILGQQ